jgi:hypothetical protein
MSAADLMPAIQSLPKEQKVELYRFLANELAREATTTDTPTMFIPPPQDGCPYAPDELGRMFQEDGGAPLSDLWRELGVR